MGGGAYNFSLDTPTPSSEKCFVASIGGRGVYNFSLDFCKRTASGRLPFTALQSSFRIRSTIIFLMQSGRQPKMLFLSKSREGAYLCIRIIMATPEMATDCSKLASKLFRSRPGKPNQRKGQKRKVEEFRAHYCEFWCFSLGKQARFTLNFCSGMPLRKVHEPTFLWFGLPGPLLSYGNQFPDEDRDQLPENSD